MTNKMLIGKIFIILLTIFFMACDYNENFVVKLTTSDCYQPVPSFLVHIRTDQLGFNNWREIYRSSYNDGFLGCLRTERRAVKNYKIIVVKEVTCDKKTCDMVYEGEL